MRQGCLFAIVVLTALLVLGITDAARAQGYEHILSFDSDITVHADSSMTVTETIRVIVQGIKIKHGIYRDFPTRYRNQRGRIYNVGFHVKGVTLNGVPENFFIEKNGHNKRVYIGNEDIYLAPGEYEYRLSYSTNRQLGFFKDFDELYWNVTGTDWQFVIDEASATVNLPAPVEPDQFILVGYTGPLGSTATNYSAEVLSPTAVRFVTTRQLAVHENLTIVAGFPKGTVSPPSLEARRRFWIADHHAEITGLIGLAVLTLFYIVAWLVVGRDPRRGSSVMLDTPPAGMSPAALRYVMRMGTDATSFTAAVIRMAAAGYLVLKVNKRKEYTLARGEAGDDVLTLEEQSLARSLFTGRHSIRIDQDNHTKLSAARDALTSGLQAQFQAGYFNRNIGWYGCGIALSIITCLIMLGQYGAPELAFMAIFTAICYGFAFVPVTQYLADHNQLFSTNWTTAEGYGATKLGLTLLYCGILLAVGMIPLSITAYLISTLMAVILLMLVLVNGLFYLLLPAYTAAGRRLMDQIGGFRRWLASPESGRFLAEDTTELTRFEQFLPYAVALGVRQEWTSQFETALSEAGRSETRLAYPVWYDNPHSDRFLFNDFTEALADRFTSSFTTASRAPSSGSGSSGGSSGGGGGGGGGGGW